MLDPGDAKWPCHLCHNSVTSPCPDSAAVTCLRSENTVKNITFTLKPHSFDFIEQGTLFNVCLRAKYAKFIFILETCAVVQCHRASAKDSMPNS